MANETLERRNSPMLVWTHGLLLGMALCFGLQTRDWFPKIAVSIESPECQQTREHYSELQREYNSLLNDPPMPATKKSARG